MRQTSSDVRQHHRLMHPPAWRGIIITVIQKITVLSMTVIYSESREVAE